MRSKRSKRWHQRKLDDLARVDCPRCLKELAKDAERRLTGLTYNPRGTVTGRFSSNVPNRMNLPRGN